VLDEKPFALRKRFQPVLSQQRVIDALLKSQPVRDCFIGATYEAERRAMTPQAINAAFRNVGLLPFDRMRVMELAHMNMGWGQREPTWHLSVWRPLEMFCVGSN